MSELLEHMLVEISKLPKAEQEALAAMIQKRLSEQAKSDKPSLPSIGFWL